MTWDLYRLIVWGLQPQAVYRTSPNNPPKKAATLQKAMYINTGRTNNSWKIFTGLHPAAKDFSLCLMTWDLYGLIVWGLRALAVYRKSPNNPQKGSNLAESYIYTYKNKGRTNNTWKTFTGLYIQQPRISHYASWHGTYPASMCVWAPCTGFLQDKSKQPQKEQQLCRKLCT